MCIHRWLTLAVPLCLGILTPLAADEAADHEALRGLKALYEQAIQKDDLSLLAPFLTDGFTGVMVTGEVVTGLAGLEDYWRRMKDLIGPGGSYSMTIEPDLSQLFGDLALATGTSRDVVRTSDASYEFTSAWTALARRVDGQWRLHRIQGAMDPIQNPFVQAGLKKAVTPALITGGLTGLIVGLILGALFFRRRSQVQE